MDIINNNAAPLEVSTQEMASIVENFGKGLDTGDQGVSPQIVPTTVNGRVKRRLRLGDPTPISKKTKNVMENRLFNKSFHPSRASTQFTGIDEVDNLRVSDAVTNSRYTTELDMHPLDEPEDLVMESPPRSPSPVVAPPTETNVKTTDTNSNSENSMDTNVASQPLPLNVLDETTPEDMDSTELSQPPITNPPETPITGRDVTGWRETQYKNMSLGSRQHGPQPIEQRELWLNNDPLTYHQAVNGWRMHAYQVSPWKRIRDSFYNFTKGSNMTGCFTVGEGSSYAAKVSVTDEMPRHVILSMGKNQQKNMDMQASGFYLPVNMVTPLLTAVKDIYDDIASGAVVSVKKLRLSSNQSKVIVRWGGNGKPLELYYNVPQDIREIAIRNASNEKNGSSSVTNNGATNVLYNSRYHVNKEALIRIARSEVNQFIECLKDVRAFITHLNTVLDQREKVLSEVVKKYKSAKKSHQPRKNYYESIVDATHSNQDEETVHKYPLCIIVPHIYNSYINEPYAL